MKMQPRKGTISVYILLEGRRVIASVTGRSATAVELTVPFWKDGKYQTTVSVDEYKQLQRVE